MLTTILSHPLVGAASITHAMASCCSFSNPLPFAPKVLIASCCSWLVGDRVGQSFLLFVVSW
jgi:hypothetical protein